MAYYWPRDYIAIPMKHSFYRNKFLSLKKNPDPVRLECFSNQLALSFLDRFLEDDRYEAEFIEVMCDLASAFEDESLNRISSSALFGIVVGRICDDSEEFQTELYDRVMSQIISFCRKLPSGREFNKCLHEFGLFDSDDMKKRVEKLRAESGNYRKLPRNPKKIIVLSGGSVSANVAITSVIVQRLSNRFPGAELVLVGDSMLSELFGGNSNLRIVPLPKPGGYGLIERFDAWHNVLEIVGKETSGGFDGTLLFDPESKLSQLGTLPLIDDSRYFFFNSQGSQRVPSKLSLSRFTNLWMDKVLSEAEFCYPRVWLAEAVLLESEKFVKKLRKKGCRKIIVVNFSVGGKIRKRVEGDFEEKLILKILDEPKTVVILDTGVDPDEIERSGKLLEAAKRNKFSTRDVQFGTFEGADISSGLIGIRSGIGEMAALIAASNEFIGYDSGFQHIAASLGISTVTVFAGSNNPRFIRRWNASGPGKNKVIHADTLTCCPRPVETGDIIDRVMDARA